MKMGVDSRERGFPVNTSNNFIAISIYEHI